MLKTHYINHIDKKSYQQRVYHGIGKAFINFMSLAFFAMSLLILSYGCSLGNSEQEAVDKVMDVIDEQLLIEDYSSLPEGIIVKVPLLVCNSAEQGQSVNFEIKLTHKHYSEFSNENVASYYESQTQELEQNNLLGIGSSGVVVDSSSIKMLNAPENDFVALTGTFGSFPENYSTQLIPSSVRLLLQNQAQKSVVQSSEMSLKGAKSSKLGKAGGKGATVSQTPVQSVVQGPVQVPVQSGKGGVSQGKAGVRQEGVTQGKAQVMKGDVVQGKAGVTQSTKGSYNQTVQNSSTVIDQSQASYLKPSVVVPHQAGSVSLLLDNSARSQCSDYVMHSHIMKNYRPAYISAAVDSGYWGYFSAPKVFVSGNYSYYYFEKPKCDLKSWCML